MGIDIYTEWPEQSREEQQAQKEAWATDHGGRVGYLREAYHGEPYSSYHLMPEAFDDPDGGTIPSATLRARLPETLRLARERIRKVYDITDEAKIERGVKQYTDFVEFCEAVEAETGRPPTIFAWW
jgi:hypothetical protein